MWSHNLFEAMRRLGIKDGKQPDLFADAVLPALVVGDVSALAPPLLPPMAWAGAHIVAVVGERCGVEIIGGGRGGTLIRTLIFTTTAGSQVVFQKSASRLYGGTLGAIPSPLEQFGVGNVTAQVGVGTTNIALPTDIPKTGAPNNNPLYLVDPVMLEPGHFFYAIGGSVNMVCYAAVQLQDVPAVGSNA